MHVQAFHLMNGQNNNSLQGINMVMCTYLNDSDYTAPTSNAELNSMLEELKQKTGDDWRLEEEVYEVKRLFRKPKKVALYTLYYHIHSIEFQIINFYRLESETSINVSVSADVMAAFLLGMLADKGAQ